MTEQERAMWIVEARLAGVHPDWIKWFLRPDAHPDDPAYVLRNPHRYQEPPRVHYVRSLIDKNPK